MFSTSRQIPSSLLSRRRNSSTHYQLVIPELNNSVNILSVGSDGQVLLGRGEQKQLYVYSEDGYLVTTVAIPFYDRVIDAVWSPREHHIVCATVKTRTTAVMSVSGDVVHHTQMIAPRYLSVSPDNEIYVTCTTKSLYYSTDNGTSWKGLVAQPNFSWEFVHALKVKPSSALSNYAVWLIESNDPEWRLSIYTPKKWTALVLPNAVNIRQTGRMTFDGHTNIYLTDYYNKAVHVWSVNGQYVQLLIPFHTHDYAPENLAMNKQRSMLYVAEDGVKVFAVQT
jgi:hypothetical protein